ncbi:MAG: YciI family protein [Limimaricola soesokkakensis]|uniref:YciI family protein n=1 Tax=Limimaricola soesokkakensis TaxID=1343159 RepID=UPI004057D219
MTDKRFMYIYHGNGMGPPESEEAGREAMARWQGWMDGIRDNIVDEGAPAGKSHTVSQSGVTHDGGANPVYGYTLITAPDIDAAIAMAKDCPMVADGGSVEVCEAIQM